MNDAAAHNIELRVPLLTSTSKDAELTRGILHRAGIDSLSCKDLKDLCAKLREGAGAALIVEEALAGENDEMLARYVDEQPFWSDLPLLVLARPGADSSKVASAMDKLGNVTVLERPIRIASLVSAVRSALRARARQYQVREDAEALRSARDDLEMRVSERTSQLSEANKLLEQKMLETEAAEKRAHALLRELVTAQETERARIARDLHDELGQQLTSLRLRLSQIERELPKRSRARSVLDYTVREAQKIDSRVSFLAWMIRPTTIEDLGLLKALQGYVHEWSRNFDITVDFGSRRWPRARLLPEIEINTYRIAQECLNNIAKYAEATTVSVLLTIKNNQLTLIIEDNGKGFDTTAEIPATGSGGLGISGMRERTGLLQGVFDIESTPGGGTTVYVRIPARFRQDERSSAGSRR
jgi:signal transduction histidine kinase